MKDANESGIPPQKQNLLIISDTPIIASGLARCTRELANIFSEKYNVAIAGWHHNFFPHSYPYFIYPLQKGSNFENKQLYKIIDNFKPDIILSIGDMWDFSNYLGSIMEFKETNNCKWIVWTTIDGENLSKSWTPIIKNADKLVSFSNFGCKEIKNTYGIDIDFIYPGVNKETFHVGKPKDLKLKNNKIGNMDIDKLFTVINISQNTDRKNIPATIEAFAEFSKDKEDVKLFLITDPYDIHGFNLWKIIKAKEISNKTLITKGAESIDGSGVSDEQLNLMYNMANVLLLTSIGEGFGFPIVEAMACKTIPITTDYAATTELLEDNRGVLIEPSAYIYGSFDIKRAIISKELLVKSLNELYYDWKGDKSLSNNIKNNCKLFADNLTWGNTADRFSKIFNDLFEAEERSWVKKDIQVKDLKLLMVVPSWGKNCGIAEYSKELIEAIRGNGHEVTVYPNNDTKKLKEFLEKSDFNVIHFQHEFSFFDSNEFIQLLNDLKNKKTIVTIHSVIPGMISFNRNVVKGANEVLCHAKMFKDRIIDTLFPYKFDNFTPDINLNFIPMGVKPLIKNNSSDIIKKKLNIEGRYPIIGSFGFLREQKGFDDLLLAVKLMKKKYPKILFYLYSPLHEFGSKQYDESFLQWIEKTNMQGDVLILRDYLNDEEMIQCLQVADLFVLNYKDTPAGGGISAAVKTLMRTGKPILTSNSFMFADLICGEVAKVKDTSPENLSGAIDSLLSDTELQTRILDNSSKYLIENSWDNIAKKHMEIYLK